MESTEAPSRGELLRRATELVPLLSKHANWSEDNRRLSEEVINALTEQGLLKMRVPKRYGGYESDAGTVVEVLAELARGDGSTSWTAGVWAISTWAIAMFPDEVQDEVFSTPDVRICGILSPSAVAVPTDGGVVLNGKWSFNTGAQQSHWNTNAAVRATPDGGYEPVMVALPVSDLEIVDDWYTSGLRGSGSVTTIAKDVFVPEQRVLSMGPVLQGQSLSPANAESQVFSSPFLPIACTTVGATVLGLAKAAKDAFFERLPERKITYTSYEKQSEAPITHLQVAEATVKIDEAEFHARRAASLVDAKTGAGEEWTIEERARIRLDLGAACQRAKEAVDILNTASGGSSIYSSVPIQRIERDVQTLNLHAIMHPNTNMELYGRVLCGLEPNTLYI
ncbi:acyl-CoA dehydrogenase family protein [Nocardiopsis ansamitocini]|uniref:Acyl-CoA dehydrogenase n=1 Tax=Nocardiopsis ansamitocini TaxID=1670832 RepID=A0A9W6UK43_9ACTN|nr:acyl-CoA dehydrogenase family protein [Nocardiopsis ansamitocini]GLU48695.1 acyl-CoA dehydrogenase [Nocardiopsis ansamitocini]